MWPSAGPTRTLVGIAPLYHFTHADGEHAGRCLTLIGCLEVSDYLDLIIAKGWEEQVYSASPAGCKAGRARGTSRICATCPR
ncbi:MAG: hypothetical protein R3A10_16485 [Caldilineaceae bacterium]